MKKRENKADKVSRQDIRGSNNNNNNNNNKDIEANIRGSVDRVDGCDKRQLQKPLIKAESTGQHSLLLLNPSKEEKKGALKSSSSSSSNGNGKGIIATETEAAAAAVVEQQQNIGNNALDQKQNKMTYCLKGKWVLILSMSIFFILTAILLAILATFILQSNDDQCLDDIQFQNSQHYKLFSTKTTYSAAYNQLNNSQSSSSFLKSSSVPKLFLEQGSDSLKNVNYRLINQDGCKVRQLHYFGRHAARFPGKNKIKEINKHIAAVQNRIDLSQFSQQQQNNNNANQQQQQQQQSSNKSPLSSPQTLDTSSTTNSTSTTSPTNVCYNPLTSYKQWESFMVPEQANLIDDGGFEETTELAKRFKSIYPELFDASKTKIEFGTTQELRTAQTALVFLRQTDNYDWENKICQRDQFPADNLTSDKSKAQEVTENQCFKKLIENYQTDKLQFHKKCEHLHEENITLSLNLDWKNPNRTKQIANSVSKKLKLTKPDEQLNADELDAIFDVCKFELALEGSSIWCNLFTEQELKFYEYLNDVDDFFTQAYGYSNQFESACPVTTELIKAFQSPQAKPEANFYFTHSQVIQKILAASIDLTSDRSYSVKNVQAHLNSGTFPEEREWRTSLFTPFSANLAFVLYECPKNRRQSSPIPTHDDGSSIDVSGDQVLTVVASLNERTIKLDGCDSHECKLDSLLKDSRIHREKRCNLKDICRKNIVVT